MNNYKIYTDGAYAKGYGGIGFIIYKDNNIVFSFGKSYTNTTNQRMEIMACVIALSFVTGHHNITIFTDSMYVVGTMNNKWKRRCNNDLWDKLDYYNNIHNVKYEHIKGHSRIIGNELADFLATEAIKWNT